MKPLRTGSAFPWTLSSHPLCCWPTLCQTLRCCERLGPGLISSSPFAASHKGVLVWDPQVLPQCKQLQPVQKRDEGLFLSPFNWFCNRKWSTARWMAEGLGKQPLPFTRRKSSLNSSQRARQPLEEGVGSVLKAADNPSSGSFTASAKVPTGLWLTIQPAGKALIETAALSSLSIRFITLLVIMLNVVIASLAFIRLLLMREKVRQGKLCYAHVGTQAMKT